MLENLNKMFISRYSKRFSEMNRNVYISAKNDAGNYEVPVPVLGKGGATLVIGATKDLTELKSPALVKVENKVMKPQLIVYRVAFPLSEMQIANNKPEYFNYLVDRILETAVRNYAVTFGDENQVRFGTSYCTYDANGDGNVFRQLNDEVIELRLVGNWASNEEA